MHTVTPLDRVFFHSSEKQTLDAAYVPWMCNCANFVEVTKYKANPGTEPKESDYFFLEPAVGVDPWSVDSMMCRKVRVAGSFSLDEGIPLDFPLGDMEDKPPHARVFVYERIEYLPCLKD